jgi:hypothetical protein
VADGDGLDLAYADPSALLRDLQAAGETNAIRLRDRRIMQRTLLPTALASLPRTNGRLAVRLDIGMMSGWAPAESQPKPLKPGQFTTKMTDVFGDPETPNT